jgi:Fe-S oxidoreductase
LEWAEALDVPTTDENPAPEVLWWVGCAPATDPRAQKTAQAFARILNHARVNFAVLGEREQCTGDAARRSGYDYLFFELATANGQLLNAVRPKRIVTTCPHCLHTLMNEYPDFGCQYEVIHHSQLLQELIDSGRIRFREGVDGRTITFHDPCYLGRQNDILEPPRRSLRGAGITLTEMSRRGRQSFCCGAGGGQVWKEEEEGQLRVGDSRLIEAAETGAEELAVGCPFCMIMFESADMPEADIEIRDIAELLDERMQV